MTRSENNYNPKAYNLSVETYEKAEGASELSIMYSMKFEESMNLLPMADKLKVMGIFYKVENPEELMEKTPQEILEITKE